MAAAAEPWDGWLIPPYFGPEGRDSLGRGLDPASVAAAVVAKDRAVRQRFGDEAVRAMMRSRGGPIEAASVRHEDRPALRAVSRTVHVLEEGEFARMMEVRAERLAPRQALGLRRGLGR